MSKRLYFAKADKVAIGDMVWYYRTNVLLGPLLIVDHRYAGYGNNAKRYWVLFDSSRNEYHSAESKYLRIPQECT